MGRDRIEDHIERCIELYGCPIDADFAEAIERPSYEQMRADIMLLVGMVAALRVPPVTDKKD